MKPNLLFLTLRVFSETGGIEKVSRVAGKALYELSGEKDFALQVCAAYDQQADINARYFPQTVFRGFGGRKTAFVVDAIKRGSRADLVILSHINLLSVGYAIKRLSPRTKLVLLAHGIEVWRPLSAFQRRMLRSCDQIIPVSRFTEAKLLQLHGLERKKLHVLNNCLDPFLPRLFEAGKSAELLRRYGFSVTDKIILTLTRLSYKERYKGYDEVLMAVKALKKKHNNLRYLIVGKHDKEEKNRLDRLILQQGLQDEVVVAGFIPDQELPGHFGLADVYAMPSRKEGFGIVFIEALYYGLPVIAGNIDGSVDALAEGELGWLVNPDRPDEILSALKKILGENSDYKPKQDDVLHRFGFPSYKRQLWRIVQPLFRAKTSGNAIIDPNKDDISKTPNTVTMSKPSLWKQL